jgi:hypothetical protein
MSNQIQPLQAVDLTVYFSAVDIALAITMAYVITRFPPPPPFSYPILSNIVKKRTGK